MKAAEFQSFRNRLGQSRAELARSLSLSEEEIQAVEEGSSPVTTEIEASLYRQMSRFLAENGTDGWPYEDFRPDRGGALRKKRKKVSQFQNIIGQDPKMQVVYQLIEDVAALNTTVMIEGESGTGKELVARAVHSLSPRRDNPFVVINCSAFPETLLESELFGHEKGAFTGASKTRAGRFEQADGGTIFLDEIGDISAQAQVKLLRIIQTQKLKRLGGDEVISVNIRIITATNKNLKEEVQEKKFRADLYYRLHVIPLFLPALRNKPNDIPLLSEHFLQVFNKSFNKNISGFSPAAMARLMGYNWPGNIRELQHCIEYAVALARGDLIELENLPLDTESLSTEDNIEYDETLISVEKRHITHVLQSSMWNKKEAARRLGISRSSLYEKIRRLEISQH